MSTTAAAIGGDIDVVGVGGDTGAVGTEGSIMTLAGDVSDLDVGFVVVSGVVAGGGGAAGMRLSGTRANHKRPMWI